MKKVVDTIKIEKLEGGAFNVVQGDRYSDQLGWDEMLGLVSALTMPEDRPHTKWMKTKEEHEAQFNSLKKAAEDITEVEFEDILVPKEIGIYQVSRFPETHGDGLFIKFGVEQYLGFYNDNWVVNNPVQPHRFVEPIQCKLIPCNREDLKVGDTACANLLDKANDTSSYCKILNEKDIAYPTSHNGISITDSWNVFSMQWYKVVPVCG